MARRAGSPPLELFAFRLACQSFGLFPLELPFGQLSVMPDAGGIPTSLFAMPGTSAPDVAPGSKDVPSFELAFGGT